MRCVTRNGKPAPTTIAILAGIPLILGLTSPALKIDGARVSSGVGDLFHFLGRLIVAPDVAFLPKLLSLILETLLIAYVASVVSVCVSVPLSLLAARNCAPHPAIGWIVRTFANLSRAIPDLVLALVLASAVGLGSVPGIVALAVAGTGFLVKSYAEALEVVDRRPIEGITSLGADAFSIRWLGIVPQALPDLISSSLYQLDVNLRNAAILGAVGAGASASTFNNQSSYSDLADLDPFSFQSI